MADIVNIADYRKSKEDILANIDMDKLMRLYDDVMNSGNIHDIIEHATIEFTRNIITQMYEMDIDPADEKIADDMVFVTMLFTAVIEEYFTGRYDASDGEENTMYRIIEDMKKVKN